MEALLHYVWQHKLYDPLLLFTSDQQPLTVLDPGIRNTDAGPDFFNAKIKIGDQLWAGNVEIHRIPSDWMKHKHDLDDAYDSVILHVVEIPGEPIRRKNGQVIPQIVLRVPEPVRKNYEYLFSKEYFPACADRISEVPGLYLTDWLDALTFQRLEQKTEALYNLLDRYRGDWNEVFYITLSRNFGFGINNDAFERLAKSLPVKYVLKHKDSIVQTEALFLGQAGLLNEEECEDAYYLALQREYRFLQKKYNLRSPDSTSFKKLRIRPANFPHIKLVQLAGLIRNQEYIFSKILESESTDELRALFIMGISEYWKTRYSFGKTSSRSNKIPGKASLEIILINTVVPVLFAYGKKKNETGYITKALDLLESLNPEKNRIVTLFSRTGIQARHAGDTQALIQLNREFCEKKKCIFCRIGYKLLSSEESPKKQ